MDERIERSERTNAFQTLFIEVFNFLVYHNLKYLVINF